jgi:hypothetical protein
MKASTRKHFCLVDEVVYVKSNRSGIDGLTFRDSKGLQRKLKGQNGLWCSVDQVIKYFESQPDSKVKSDKIEWLTKACEELRGATL